MAEVYFDANSTTLVPKAAREAMIEWINVGNPSAANDGAARCRGLLDEFRTLVARATGAVGAAEPGQDANPRAYKVLITSGASESNSTLIRSAVEAYRFSTRKLPHLVVGAVEHKCVLACVQRLAEVGAVDVTWLAADELGRYNPADAAKAFRSNTALLVLMGANNETGAVNDVAAFGRAAAEHQIPFHCDAAQLFGKLEFRPLDWGVSSFALSAHKVHGPKGVGALAIRRDFADGYGLAAIIAGSQNYGLRGGTENVAGVAGAAEGLRATFANFAKKTKRLRASRDALLRELAAHSPVLSYPSYLRERESGVRVPGRRFVILTPGLSLPTIAPSKGGPQIAWDSGFPELALPNTLLLALVEPGKKVCNVKMRAALAKKGYLVSIGSACNTASPLASHVIRAMGADDAIASGALRISLPQSARREDCVAFARALAKLPAE